MEVRNGSAVDSLRNGPSLAEVDTFASLSYCEYTDFLF